MNTLYEVRVAQKYAQAFLATYVKNIDEEEIERIQLAGNTLKNNIEAKSILAMPVHEVMQRQFIEMLCKTFNLPASIQRLLSILAQHYRLHLTSTIFLRIAKLYFRTHGIETVTIKSSIQLSPEQQHEILSFITKKIGKKMRPVFMIDTTLISGIRIQSDSFLWEYSVRKQLNAIPSLLMRTEGTYGN